MAGHWGDFPWPHAGRVRWKRGSIANSAADIASHRSVLANRGEDRGGRHHKDSRWCCGRRDSSAVVNEDPGGSGKYQFNPSELSFKVGDRVAFTLTAETEFHTFTVDDLGIDEALSKGEEVNFTFTFDRAGTFDLVCLVHGGPQGMVGTITVKP